MKKRNILFMIMLFIPALLSAGNSLEEANQSLLGSMGIVGMLFVLVLNLFWIIVPLGLGGMSYSMYKKKADQSQEDLGMKAGVGILASVVVGVFGAYFLVGTVGKYAQGNTPTAVKTLEYGNHYMIGNFLGKMVTALENKYK